MNKRYFQWIVGDNKGQIVTFKDTEEDDGEMYVVFNDDTRVNEMFIAPLNQRDLTGKIMAEIESPDNCWKFNDKYIGKTEEVWEKNADGVLMCVQPAYPGKLVRELIPPKKTISQFKSVEDSSQQQSTQQSTQENVKIESNTPEINPLKLLIKKTQKKNANISFEIDIKLPSKDFYNLIKENFENSEQIFFDTILEEISMDSIKISLREYLINFFNEKNLE